LPEPGRLTVYTILTLILIVAGGARLMRAGEGLPYLHNWDEPLVANRALRMMQTGDLNPHYFNYGTVTVYTVLAVDILHYYRLAGLPVGDPSSLKRLSDIKTGDDTSWLWDISHPSFYLWDRRLFAILGTASVALCFLLARRVSGDWAGILAAAALAGLEYDISYSAMITPNLPVSFLVLLSVLFACLFIQRDEPLFLIGSLVSCGLATATKYNASVSLVTPVLALSLSALGRRSGHRRWLWAAVPLVPLASFLIAMPYALLDLPNFLNDSAFELRHYNTGHGDATVVPGATHLGLEIREIATNVGLPFALFAAAGLAVWARTRSTWILLAFPVTYLLFMATMRVLIGRNLLAIYPFAAVAFGCGAVSISGWLARAGWLTRAWPAQRALPRAVVIALVLLPAGLCGVRLSVSVR